MALLDRDMALPANKDWLALVLRRRLQAQHVVLAVAYRRVAWHRAGCSLDAVRSQVKEGYVGGYYIEASCHRLLAAADLWNFVVSVPVEDVPVV
ncbi:MAG: hypothetical protein NTW48_01565 [Chloroflexi bacterium]|nr:hypothetical protein [Chloroflexota bacterium]